MAARPGGDRVRTRPADYGHDENYRPGYHEGGTRFGFFLPEVQVTLGQQVPVATIGMLEMFSGPNSVPRGPATWQCVHLHGTAQEVEVALLAKAPA